MMDRAFELSNEDLIGLYGPKYSRTPRVGWGPAQRLAFGYFSPDDHYEALVGKLLAPGAAWCDVGCGRNIFPDYPELAKQYAERCGFVYGIDPDDNVRENAFVHAYFQGTVEDCPIERQFDLITLRMVAEHIVDPTRALSAIARMLKRSGRVIIYTPHKWAPISIVANLTPFVFHNPLKQFLWPGIESRDTFPTQYKMNTYALLRKHAEAAGLSVAYYVRLDDCRITAEYRRLNRLELGLRRTLRAIGLPHPEACIIAVLRHAEHNAGASAQTADGLDQATT
jgi:2-polyprenyl-3-methyl-5-hydroxy-6-metoxy-1,4-benzoquinol methylase